MAAAAAAPAPPRKEEPVDRPLETVTPESPTAEIRLDAIPTQAPPTPAAPVEAALGLEPTSLGLEPTSLAQSPPPAAAPLEIDAPISASKEAAPIDSFSLEGLETTSLTQSAPAPPSPPAPTPAADLDLAMATPAVPPPPSPLPTTRPAPSRAPATAPLANEPVPAREAEVSLATGVLAGRLVIDGAPLNEAIDLELVPADGEAHGATRGTLRTDALGRFRREGLPADWSGSPSFCRLPSTWTRTWPSPS